MCGGYAVVACDPGADPHATIPAVWRRLVALREASPFRGAAHQCLEELRRAPGGTTTLERYLPIDRRRRELGLALVTRSSGVQMPAQRCPARAMGPAGARTPSGTLTPMELAAARRLALDLMRSNGIPEWGFAFDRAKRRLGSCRYAQRTLTLSAPLTRLNPEHVVRDTVLHEIAHALTPGAGHGPRWRSEARRLGAAPRPCVDAAELSLPPAPYALVCDACGARLPRYRRPRRRFVCRSCFERHRRGLGPRPQPLRVVDAVTG
jgi:predicted SprT family Zn-dependent metalloprotease